MKKKPRRKRSIFFLSRFDIKPYLCHIKKVGEMFKKLALVFLWFLITPVVIAALTITAFGQHKKAQPGKLAAITQTSLEIQNTVQGEVIKTQITDMRPFLVSNFLKHTTLEPYSKNIVEASDKYNLDYRLIPAIAMKESGGGNAAPANSFNAWGFENGRTHFTSWEVAIDNVAKTLKTRYIDRGLTTPDEIMPIYAPPALENGGQWAKDINSFFTKMDSL